MAARGQPDLRGFFPSWFECCRGDSVEGRGPVCQIAGVSETPGRKRTCDSDLSLLWHFFRHPSRQRAKQIETTLHLSCGFKVSGQSGPGIVLERYGAKLRRLHGDREEEAILIGEMGASLAAGFHV